MGKEFDLDKKKYYRAFVLYLIHSTDLHFDFLCSRVAIYWPFIDWFINSESRIFIYKDCIALVSKCTFFLSLIACKCS